MKAALFSVTDKTGIGLFAKRLKELFPEMQLIASGGTAKELEKFGLMPTPLETITGFPECFGGRVKTINPKIAGGLLYRRGQDDADAKRLGVPAIDLVVCNLYRFDEGTDFIESMDIGGPTLIRCGIKNYQAVAVVTDPTDYASLLKQLETAGCLSLETRAELAVKAINLTANYEAKLAEELTNRLQKRQTFRPFLDRGEKLRYGENPDQEAWIYRFPEGKGIAHAEVLAGKELSYNNYEDATAAYNAASHLLSVTEAPGVAIVKHGGLCGMATAKDPKLAFRRAWQCDSLSAFGGIIACNAPLDFSFTEELKGKFFEVLIAPDFSCELV
ncbi:MAG: bifunctional phosphoribosylaminoimidazolecarboxamide formyltransferase/IMP cyclohydrolase PurH, partial [Chlamydiia bacterium]|nr:bifunctional phosphoribosylaminoimidazolecarboxamide formyltransferase/IMP cyclohydrolase PurH [Chlamydiia bacterium]